MTTCEEVWSILKILQIVPPLAPGQPDTFLHALNHCPHGDNIACFKLALSPRSDRDNLTLLNLHLVPAETGTTCHL